MNKKSAKSASSRSDEITSDRFELLLKRVVNASFFGKAYIVVCLIVLIATTIFWASLGSKVQQSNADQLVNFYLLDHVRQLHTAILPGQHSFLLKWPLYLLVGLSGFSVSWLNFFTIGVVVCTVMAFAFILYAIERRPLVFGTICLALASTLMLVPAEPYPGGVLPVNMAMLSTRNIEYIVYIVVLVLFIRARRLRSWFYVLGIVLMTGLIASDKLFLLLSLGGSLITMVLHTFTRRWALVNLSALWLTGTAVAGVLASLLLYMVNTTHFAHIASSGSVNPYNLTTGFHSFELAIIYAVFALFTVFGANPATDTRLLHRVPDQVFHTLLSVSGITLIINITLLLAGLVAAGILLQQTTYRGRHEPSDSQSSLSIMLLWSAIVAFGLFVGTSHYYPVDARYVGIALFALFVIGTTHIRRLELKSEYLLFAGLILLIGLVAGIPLVSKSYHSEMGALSPTESRNEIVAQLLQHRPVDVLLGDYWRVLPIKFDSGSATHIVPLGSCTQQQSIQTSTAWPVDLRKNSFAYLLTLDKSLTNSSSCSLGQIVSAYGRPNASSVIAGTILHPKELLLFYDSGIHKSAPLTPQPKSGPTTVVPISLSQLPYTTCDGPTTMNVVAHEDDDLLFMNPDTLNSIKAGFCVRTIYLTAGDAGQGQYYWLDRERGAEAAYSYMLDSNAIWVQRLVKLSNNEIVTVANPRGNAKISLIFFHLPDGDLRGQGFSATGSQSIEQLYGGKIPYITSVDGESKYTAGQLTNDLESFMHTYQPTTIRTQATYDALKSVPEHSDHMAAGLFAQKAYTKYEADAFDNQVTIPLKFYIGYPVRDMSSNISGTDLTEKTNIFLSYAHNDPAVCGANIGCLAQKNNYTLYLSRQYSRVPNE